VPVGLVQFGELLHQEPLITMGFRFRRSARGMHAEELAVQDEALPLFERFSDSRTVDVASRHRDVIARFGRFPHRNAALGRISNAEELGFLQTPGSRF